MEHAPRTVHRQAGPTPEDDAIVQHDPFAAPGFWDAVRGAGARRDLLELLDHPAVDARALAGNLHDLRLLNRTLGWSALVWREVDALMRRHELAEATVLDVATGSADIPRAIVRRARGSGRAVRVIASDVSRPVLREARRTRHAADAVALVQHDGALLPFRDGAVDVALCCLAAHHFSPPTLMRVLTELWRVARRAVLMSDLRRSRDGYVLARLMALVLRNPLTAHDGPVSVLRAYTPAELCSLARSAGLERVRVRTSFPARMTLIAEKRPAAMPTP